MSEAPERIWADMDGCWWDKPYGESPEYVRCDMLQEIFARYSRVEADHIEELEAKLAKAVEALGLALELADNDLVDFSEYGLSCDADINERYRTTLAVLKGETDE